MEFQFTAEDQQFRQEVRAFIKANWGESGSGGGGEVDDLETHQRTRAFEKRLAERGWLTMAWPNEYGGQGASHIRQMIFREECAYFGAPGSGGQGINMIGPCIMVHGTEDQKQRFLPPIASAEVMWCQGFSEPGSGSDLASLQTRATLDGDDYVINGQKIWTSGAQFADYIHVLARTDPDAPKHRGITYFLLDMKSPGISVRPIVQMHGRSGFNETFFDNVRVPRSNVLGEANRGWYAAATTLDFERSGVSVFAAGKKLLERQGAGAGAARDLPVDSLLMPGAVLPELAAQIEQAGPFGAAAPAPRFAIPAATISARRFAGRHLRLTLQAGAGAEAIAFGAVGTPLGEALERAGHRPFHLAGRLEQNVWRGRVTARLLLDDAAPA